MSPFSQERVQWIEARLFCLARMIRELYASGLRTATKYNPNAQDAQQLFHKTMQDLQAERLALMIERKVIQDYDEEQKSGS